MRSRVAGPVSLLAAAGVAVAASSTGAADDSGIRGRVVPCGLIHERAAACAVSVTAARVTVRARPGGPALEVVRAGRDGRFQIGMAPGAYVVEARVKSAPRQPAPPTVPATVPDGGWVSVVLPAGRMVAPAGRLGR